MPALMQKQLLDLEQVCFTATEYERLHGTLLFQHPMSCSQCEMLTFGHCQKCMQNFAIFAVVHEHPAAPNRYLIV